MYTKQKSSKSFKNSEQFDPRNAYNGLLISNNTYGQWFLALLYDFFLFKTFGC